MATTTTATATKKNLGRQKIEIKKIVKKSSLEVTFTKRRGGLFNKASELSILTGCQAAVIVFSPGNKSFAHGHPSVDSVIERYLTERSSDTYGEEEVNSARQVEEPKKQYLEALARLDEEKRRVKMVKGAEVGELGGSWTGEETFWWDQAIEDMGLEELEKYVACMEELKKKIGVRVKALEDRGNSPSRFLAL